MATQILTNASSAQAQHSDSWCESFDDGMQGLEPRPKAMLLGLPCSRCSAYYAADLEACPICGCKQRISAAWPTASAVVM